MRTTVCRRQPGEALPSAGGPQTAPGEGAAPRQPPSPLCSLGRHGHLTQKPRTRVPTPNNERGEVDTGEGSWDGMEASPTPSYGKEADSQQLQRQCKPQGGAEPEHTAQLEDQAAPKGTGT